MNLNSKNILIISTLVIFLGITGYFTRINSRDNETNLNNKDTLKSNIIFPKK